MPHNLETTIQGNRLIANTLETPLCRGFAYSEVSLLHIDTNPIAVEDILEEGSHIFSLGFCV